MARRPESHREFQFQGQVRGPDCTFQLPRRLSLLNWKGDHLAEANDAFGSWEKEEFSLDSIFSHSAFQAKTSI